MRRFSDHRRHVRVKGAGGGRHGLAAIAATVLIVLSPKPLAETKERHLPHARRSHSAGAPNRPIGHERAKARLRIFFIVSH
jgi:hypothetical protein